MVDEDLKDFIYNLAKSGKRMDGRKNPDGFRDFQIEYDISKNAEGSARVKLGKTDVIVGVKLSVDKPYPDDLDKGTIIVNAEFSPMASPDFESGPPSGDSIELARIIDRGIRESQAIDFKKLCIVKGEKVWIVFIDIYVMNHSGNLIGAAALGTIAALSRVYFPKLNEDYTVDFKEKGKNKLEIEKVPVTCTFAKVNDMYLVDPSDKEEKIMDCRLVITTTEPNKINAMQKSGGDGLTEEEISKNIDRAVELSKDIRKLLKITK
jgi:exosome complex component RRP42